MPVDMSNKEPEIVSSETNRALQLWENQLDAKYDEMRVFVRMSKVWILAKASGEKTKIFSIDQSEKDIQEMRHQADDMFIDKTKKENVSLNESTLRVFNLNYDFVNFKSSCWSIDRTKPCLLP